MTGPSMVLVNTEGLQPGRIWAKDKAEVHDAGFAAFPTQKYRYMPSSSSLLFMLCWCGHSQATRILQGQEQHAGSIARVTCGSFASLISLVIRFHI